MSFKPGFQKFLIVNKMEENYKTRAMTCYLIFLCARLIEKYLIRQVRKMDAMDFGRNRLLFTKMLLNQGHSGATVDMKMSDDCIYPPVIMFSAFYIFPVSYGSASCFFLAKMFEKPVMKKLHSVF